MATIADDDGDQPLATRVPAGPSALTHDRPTGLVVDAVDVRELAAEDEAGLGDAASLLCEDLDGLDPWDAFTASGPVVIRGTERATPFAAVARSSVERAWRWYPSDAASTITIDGAGVHTVRVFAGRPDDAPPAIAAWERLHRPTTLRWFRPGALLDDGASGQAVTATALRAGPSLLFLHDAFGRTTSSFYGFDGALHQQLAERYGGRLWALDHATVSVTPRANADGLLAILFPDGAADPGLDVDIVAHGRGGLVAAELAHLDARLRVRQVVLVGAPVDGTPLAGPAHLAQLLGAYTTLLATTPENPLTTTADVLAATAVELAVDGPEALVGLIAMEAPLTPPPGAAVLAGRAVGTTPFDELLGPDHDGLVPVPAARADGPTAVVEGSHRGLWEPGREDLAGWLLPPVAAGADADTGDAAGTTRTGASVDAGAAAPAPASRPARRLTMRAVAPVVEAQPLRLSVHHASVEHADHAVVVGHFRGAELTQSEELLDARLQGTLSQRHLARRYPEAVGEALILRNEPGDGDVARPPAVIVVGLGTPGELTRSRLTEAVAAGLLDHALAHADRLGPLSLPTSPQLLAISARLIGTTGRSALPVETVVAAITDAALSVNARLTELAADDGTPLGQRLRIGELHFVERYADRAELAGRAIAIIGDLLLQDPAPHTELVPNTRVEPAAGAWPARSMADEPPGWQRVIVTGEHARNRTQLAFTVIGSRAQVEELTISVDTAAVTSLLERALSGGDGSVAAALFELLVPRVLRTEIAAAENLQFIVDETSGAFPWEALVGTRSGTGAGRPLNRRGGFIRQFRDTEGHRHDVRNTSSRRALVIGNAPGDPAHYPDLPFAYEEAKAVVEQLGAASIGVTSLLWPGGGQDAPDAPANDGSPVLAGLTEDVRILHIAGHGDMHPVADDGTEPITGGVVIGHGVFLTAADVLERSTVPEVVFLNCCNLGAQLEQAANLARAFMCRGAQVVVAAGWPVNDEAAKAFADRLYLEMLAGETFGVAVQRARRQAFTVRPMSLTWAAYQCYGDPGYRLAARKRGAEGVQSAVSESELIRRIRMVRTSVSDIGRVRGDRLARARLQLVNLLGELARQAEQQWKGFTVSYELGVAYAELGEFATAIAHYERAVAGNKSEAPILAVEQLGNLKIRLAQKLMRDGADADAVAALADGARRHLRSALRLGPTAERWALVGSYHKKRATIEPGKRAFHLAAAAEAYRSAYGLKPDSYPLFNYVQLHVLATDTLPDDDLVGDVGAAIDAYVAKIDATTDDQQGFWGLETRGSAGLTRLVAGPLLASRPLDPPLVARHYLEAFQLRSSWRERGSCTDHLRDLIALCTDDRAELCTQLTAIRAELTSWTRQTFGTDE